ncbi:MAG: hypothetical protein HUJ42_02275 [Malacoplasma sp.]|nr:hypothetical protein [Malacoplasma sp.]
MEKAKSTKSSQKNTTENELGHTKKINLFSNLFHKLSPSELGKQKVEEKKIKKQILIIVITLIVFIVVACVAGYLIWLVQNKSYAIQQVNVIQNSLLSFLT